MFGENLILGEGSGKLDSKNRMFIPAFTKVEPQEQLLIQLTKDDDALAFKIVAIHKYLKLIERFQKLRDNSTNINDFEKYDKEIEIICKKLDFIVKVDSHKRLQIPHNLMTKLGWNSSDEIQFSGLGESLLVRKK